MYDSLHVFAAWELRVHAPTLSLFHFFLVKEQVGRKELAYAWLHVARVVNRRERERSCACLRTRESVISSALQKNG